MLIVRNMINSTCSHDIGVTVNRRVVFTILVILANLAILPCINQLGVWGEKSVLDFPVADVLPDPFFIPTLFCSDAVLRPFEESIKEKAVSSANNDIRQLPLADRAADGNGAHPKKFGGLGNRESDGVVHNFRLSSSPSAVSGVARQIGLCPAAER